MGKYMLWNEATALREKAGTSLHSPAIKTFGAHASRCKNYTALTSMEEFLVFTPPGARITQQSTACSTVGSDAPRLWKTDICSWAGVSAKAYTWYHTYDWWNLVWRSEAVTKHWPVQNLVPLPPVGERQKSPCQCGSGCETSLWTQTHDWCHPPHTRCPSACPNLTIIRSF